MLTPVDFVLAFMLALIDEARPFGRPPTSHTLRPDLAATVAEFTLEPQYLRVQSSPVRQTVLLELDQLPS